MVMVFGKFNDRYVKLSKVGSLMSLLLDSVLMAWWAQGRPCQGRVAVTCLGTALGLII